MKATVLKWEDIEFKPGMRLLIQGAIMKFLKESTPDGEAEVRNIEVESRGMEMEMAVFNHYYTAVIDE